MTDPGDVRNGVIRGAMLDIAYEEQGPPDGAPVILLHGFPYDVRCFDDVAPRLAQAGLRVIAPYLRGFGPTRLRDANVPRSGEQGALAHDLLELADGLGLETPLIAGFDWGGRAACAAAALWPTRFAGLLAIGGYNLYEIATSNVPAPPEVELVLWYQYYFHGERGRQGLIADRRGICRLLWSLWSPSKPLDINAFERTAPSFDNPDFVEVVLHSYRHRFGLIDGDGAFASLQARLTALPPVTIPTGVLHAMSGPFPAPRQHTDERLANLLWWRDVPGVGHNVPQEAPATVADAIIELHRYCRG